MTIEDDAPGKVGYYATHPKYATDENVNVPMDRDLSSRLQQEQQRVGNKSIPALQAEYRVTQKPFAFLTGVPKQPQYPPRICESYLLAFIRELKRTHANEILDKDGEVAQALREQLNAERIVGALRAELVTRDGQIRHLREQVKKQ